MAEELKHYADALQAAPIIHVWVSTAGGTLGLGEMDTNRLPLGFRELSLGPVSPPFLLGDAWRSHTSNVKF
jgi:hypothetical protein